VLVDRAINDDLSMTVLADVTADVDGSTLAKLARAQGSDPEFFGVDADGQTIEDL
jgi:hypothetical protein